MDARTVGNVLSLGLCASLAVGCVDEQIETGEGEVAATSDPLNLAFGGAIPGLSSDEEARFAAGKISFNQTRGVPEGLGPVFNGDSCGSCHAVPVAGGFSPALETRFG